MQLKNAAFETLKGIQSYSLYPGGSLMDCMLNEYNELETVHGILVPQYDSYSVRRKYTKSLSFYEDGQIKSISLHKQTLINTPADIIPAELITFYQSGSIKRIFPLNGKISGYWTEKDEYGLAQGLAFNLPFGNTNIKIIGVQFYEDGLIKSLTLWPGESLEIPSPAGMINIRIGLSFYPNGHMKSLEPAEPTIINTPIGKVTAFNTAAIGIHGDTNSLCFHENGKLKSLATSTDIVTICQNLKIKTYGPSFEPSLLDSTKSQIVPLYLHFQDRYIRLGDKIKEEFSIDEYDFTIKHVPNLLGHTCGDCESCNACG